MIAVEVAKNASAFDCKKCQHKNCDRDGGIPDSRGSAGFPRWEIAGVIKSDVCLLPMITDFSRGCLQLYRHYKNGYLYRSGGVAEQPQIYLAAMGLIHARYA